MKTLALIARRRDIDRAEFRDHYEEIHAPLAVRTLLEGTTRYVRHHLREELFGRPAFDVVTGFWYRDAAAAIEIMRRTETPVGDAIRRDELTFMDKHGEHLLRRDRTHGARRRRSHRGTRRDRAGAPAGRLGRRAFHRGSTRRTRCPRCSTPRASRCGAFRIARCASAPTSPRSTR
jgi:hypothetical protein